MRSPIIQRGSVAALILVAGLSSSASMADTSAPPSGSERPLNSSNLLRPLRRGHLGIKVQSVDEDTAAALGLANVEGALVTEVMPEGPAALAGLRPADAILAVNGKSIADAKALPEKFPATHLRPRSN